MYNRNTRYFSRAIYRAIYRDTTVLYVVASLVSSGRSVEVEIENLARQNQRNMEASPDHFKLTRVTRAQSGISPLHYSKR